MLDRFPATSVGRRAAGVRAGCLAALVVVSALMAAPEAMAVVPAAPSLSGAPSAYTSSRSASISFSGVTGATFTCSVDGGAYASCTSPKSLSSLVDGAHSLAVKQTTSGGTSSAATANWTVDTIAPSAPSVSAPAALTNLRSASIQFSGESLATFSCSVDGGAYSTCSSPKALSALADGSHTLLVRQTDRAGNVSPSASATWTVDATAPAAPSLSGTPSAFTNSTSASIGFSGETGATFGCSLDGGLYFPCGESPYVLSGLADGDHSLAVNQMDLAGNTGPSVTVSWTVDTSAPNAPSLLGAPAAITRNRTASIRFTGESGARFMCSVDGGAYAACGSSPKAFSNLVDGDHSLAVTQIDQAGNESDPTTVAWTVDTVAPSTPVLDGAPSGDVNSNYASIGFSGDADATYSCSVDGGAFRDCGDSPKELYDLTDGDHSLDVKAVDPAGNESALASAAWTVDTVAPAAPRLGTLPSLLTNRPDASIRFSGEAGASFVCVVDAGDPAPCGTSPKVLSGLADGDHTLSVTQIDTAGNEGPSADVAWTIDTIAPDAPQLSGAPEGLVNSREASVDIVGDPDSTFGCSLDGGPFYDCGGSTKYMSDLTDGEHTLTVKQVDPAGNSSDTVSVTWSVDATAPDAPSVTLNRGTYTNLTSAAAQLGGEEGATFKCSLDSGEYFDCDSDHVYGDLEYADHTLDVTQTDPAGNESIAQHVEWTVGQLRVASPPSLSAGLKTNVNVGATVTASGYAFEGSAGELRVTRVWQRCPSTNLFQCRNIPGATGDSYATTVADVGQRLRFLVTHTTIERVSIAAASTMTGVVVPVVNRAPSIVIPDSLAAPAFGRTLSVADIAWTGFLDGTDPQYRWQRCTGTSASSCLSIPGATDPTYDVSRFDLSRRLRLLVGAQAGGVTVWASSPLSGVVTVVAKPLAPPTIDLGAGQSAPRKLRTIRAVSGGWDLTWQGTYSWQWQACTSDVPTTCADVRGQVRSLIAPSSALVGKRLRVVATYTARDHTAVSIASAITSPVLR